VCGRGRVEEQLSGVNTMPREDMATSMPRKARERRRFRARHYARASSTVTS
jgi:hypothetical protein